MNSTFSAAALLLSCLAWTPSAAASVQSDSLRWPWTTDLDAPGIFTRSASGDLDGDKRPDVVLVDGLRTVVLQRIGGGFAPSELPFSARSVDMLPASSPQGHDSVLVVDGTGLHMVWHNGTGFTSELKAAGLWAGASSVRVADLDGDGTMDVLGLSGDGRTVLWLLREPGSAATFTLASQFQAPTQVRDLAALRYTGEPPAQIALLSDWGLHIVTTTGLILHSVPSVLPGGAIAVLREPIADRLVWITNHASGGQQRLMVISALGTEELLDLGALDAVAITAGDVDADGDDDLVISHRSDHTLLWLDNLRSVEEPARVRFSLAEGSTVRRVGPGFSAPDNRAWPVLADVDGDGDLDATIGVQSTRHVWLVKGRSRDDQAMALQLDSAQFVPSGTASPSQLHLSLLAPAEIATASHVEVLVWKQGTVTGYTQALPLEYQVHSWQGGGLSITVSIPESSADFAGVYGVEVRPVILCANAREVTLPSLHVAFVADESKVDQLRDVAPDAEPPIYTSMQTGSECAVVIRRSAQGTWGRNMPPQTPQPAPSN